MRKDRFIRPLIFIVFCCFIVSAVAQPVKIPGKPPTPLEASGFTTLTTHEGVVAFVKNIASISKRVTVKTITKSIEGREIPAVFLTRDKVFGSKRSEKPIVYIFAQQHGNEASGKEAALILIREIAIGSLKDFLKHIDIIFVPMANPDGGEKGQRRNANDMDLNRNHAILSEPEVYAIHRLFLDYMPEVTLDVHEYDAIREQWINSGYIKHAEEMLDRVTNKNINASLVDFSSSVFIPEVGKKIQEDGFTFSRYIVGAPFEGQRVRHSTTSINDGRQSLGIYNTLSFIFEGKRYGDLTNKIERRTRAQVSALIAFLKTVIVHKEEILKIVGSARKKLIEGPYTEESYIQQDYFADPDRKTLLLPVFDIYKWRYVEKEIKRYMPLVRVKKSIKKPFAYIIPKSETRLIELLKKHQIKMFRLKKDTSLNVEIYSILHVTPGFEEDKASEYIDARSESKTIEIEEGSIFIFLNQKAGNLIPLLLESQSSYSICTENSGRQYRFSEYLEEGNEFPIFRLMKEVPLDLEGSHLNI